MNISSQRDSYSFCSLFYFHYLTFLRKESFCGGWFLFGVSHYVNSQLTTWKVINRTKIWWAKFELKCPLLIYSFTSIQNSKSLANKGCWIPLHQNSFRKPSKRSKITFAILNFPHQHDLTNLPSWVLKNLILLVNHQLRFKCVTYTQPIWVSQRGMRRQNLSYAYIPSLGKQSVWVSKK